MFYAIGEIIARWDIIANTKNHPIEKITTTSPTIRKVEATYKSNNQIIKQSKYSQVKGRIVDIVM